MERRWRGLGLHEESFAVRRRRYGNGTGQISPEGASGSAAQAEGCKESLRKEPKEFRADLVNPKKLRTHLKKQADLWGRCLGGECKAALSDAESGRKPSARDARDLAGARSKDESIKSGLGRLDSLSSARGVSHVTFGS